MTPQLEQKVKDYRMRAQRISVRGIQEQGSRLGAVLQDMISEGNAILRSIPRNDPEYQKFEKLKEQVRKTYVEYSALSLKMENALKSIYFAL